MEGLHGEIPKMNWEHRDLVAAWTSFYMHVEYMFKGPLQDKSGEEKCAYMMIWVGEHGREVFGTWDLTDEEKKDPEAIRAKFTGYVEPKSNTVFNRYKFQCRVQQEGETCDQFITDLRILAADCAYAGEKEKMIRDRIVFGIATNKIREKLINEGSSLTLEKATDICRTFELSQKQLKTMNIGEDPNVNVHAVRKVRKQFEKKTKLQKSSFKPSQPSSQQKMKTFKCSRCGREHEKQKCPAYGKKCNKCHGNNHFAAVCRSKDHRVNELNDEEYDYDALYVGAVYTNPKRKKRNMDMFSEILEVSGRFIEFQLDTGAKCNVLSKKDYVSLKKKGPMEKPDVALRSFSGHRLIPDGMVTLDVSFRNIELQVQFYVVDTPSMSIISGVTAEKIGLIKRIYQVETEYTNLFEGLGCIPGEYSIKIDKNVMPVVHPPRKVPIALKSKVKEELDRMERLDVIVKQKEPTEWVNSMVTVTKPNGSVRICIDPKNLNDAIQREHYPMKTVEEVVAEMPDAKVFSTLDATSGFWQIKLDEESSKLTTFNSPYGRYRFKRAPFGIKSIPEIYQRAMSEMIEGLEGTAVIVDDILVWGKDQSEHDEHD